MVLNGTGSSSNGGSAVACPVCTLYLREGISLQKHLDTHPKEHVIEALIKASSISPPTHLLSPPALLPQSPSTLQSPLSQNTSITQNTHISSQSPYPIGPIFECPSIGSMMPPQFASFSYQQFVNNGTMMIPQYAMAPQTNQMMQMLYNPYSMYQQQPISTVQMLSPVATIHNSTRARSINAVTDEAVNNRTTITLPVNNSESKQIIPEILQESEVEQEQVLPDTDLPSSNISTNEDTSTRSEENEDCRIQVEHRAQQTQNINSQDRNINHEFNDIHASMTITCDSKTENEADAALPDIEKNIESLSQAHTISVDVHYSTVHHEQSEAQQLNVIYNNETNKENINDASTIISNAELRHETEKITDKFVGNEGSENSNFSNKSLGESSENNDKPEIEQLEHLLITIMEDEFDSSKQSREKKIASDKENLTQGPVIQREETVIQDTTVITPTLDKNIENLPDTEVQIIESCKENEIDQYYNYTYIYKNSLSAPASPIVHKKVNRVYSVHSECGSHENLNFYPFGFDISGMQIDENEKHQLRDNLNEADMDIEEVHSPHTPLIKYGEDTEHLRSHTPLSTISDISILRVRKDLSKPCSPASAHSFCHMDAESINQDENSNEAREGIMIKDLINCSPITAESKIDKQDGNFLSSVEKKLDSNHIYHQSVITEHVSSFSGAYSQQPVIVHDSYSTPNNKNHNMLNLSESITTMFSDEGKIHQSNKVATQKHSTELLSISDDAHAGPMNVFEFDGLQILVPSQFISESSQKAVSATSQQSMTSSEGGTGIDEEVKSINMRADETMPPRGELSEQESNGCTEQSTWQLYIGQESSRMSTSYDLMARESWEESEGSDNEIGGPLLDSRSLATHFTSSLFLDRDRKTPTRRAFKCFHCSEVFDCPKERRVHITTVHKEAGASSSRTLLDQPEIKDIKLLDGRMNAFEDIFVPGLHVQQMYHQQQPLLHQLQPPQSSELSKLEHNQKTNNLVIPQNIESTCTICNQRFGSEKSLQIHHKRMHITDLSKRIREVSKCQICNQEFPSVILFNAHLKIHPMECGQCGKYFYRKQNFKLHMKRHLGIKPFPCTVCDKAFLTKQKLDEHTNGHTGNAPVKCNLCNETFRRYSNLTQHKNRHHLNIKKKLKDYICHCGEVFHTKKKLAWHKETHDEKPKACTYCNERFIHMASLTRHMRRAHNRRFVPDAQRENENVECPICKCIYLRSSLAVHMRVHNGERPYECQVCSKTFSTKWNLQLHKWTHAARSTKPYKCNQCNAAFYRHSDYTAHMNSHRNVRPYTCNYCGAQFIRKYNCLRHVKEHEENKAYTCDVCNKTFHRSYYLKEHLRVHSGARPYTCHICGKSSGTKSNHNKHVRIHHAREPVNTEN
ncbi:uncharacterized protein [Prorops nasuta]|uniref:uncharacterized protein n=1 Tax=Prorops nasuta TaxID=863751 RepID=UPI0034CD17D8